MVYYARTGRVADWLALTDNVVVFWEILRLAFMNIGCQIRDVAHLQARQSDSSEGKGDA